MSPSTNQAPRAHLDTFEKSWFLRALTYAGAILAFLIGSGFATGQEILQYFTSYGYWGVFGTGLLVLVLLTYAAMEFLYAGHTQTLDRPSRIFHYYCGRYRVAA